MNHKKPWYASESFRTVGRGTQLAVTVAFGFFVGYKLDLRWDIFPWLTLLGAAAGLGIGLYQFIKEFSRDASR